MITCGENTIELGEMEIQEIEEGNLTPYIYCNKKLNADLLKVLIKKDDYDEDVEYDNIRLNIYGKIIDLVPTEDLIKKENDEFLKYLVISLREIYKYVNREVYLESSENSKRANELLKKLVKKIEKHIRYKLNVETEKTIKSYRRQLSS